VVTISGASEESSTAKMGKLYALFVSNLRNDLSVATQYFYNDVFRYSPEKVRKEVQTGERVKCE
jgi:hypothetical protein